MATPKHISDYYTISSPSRQVDLAPEKFLLLFKRSGEIVPSSQKNSYHCPSCDKLMFKAMQTSCGHRLCHECANKDANASKVCLVCQEPIEGCNPDPAFKRDIKKMLKASCPVQSCAWMGEVESIKDHIEQFHSSSGDPCQYGCGEFVVPASAEQHRVSCDFRPITCKHCSVDLQEYQQQEHFLKDCIVNLCLGCNKSLTTKNELLTHLRTCPDARIPCPLFDVGCRSWVPMDKVGDHVSSPEHTFMILKLTRALHSQLQQHVASYSTSSTKHLSPSGHTVTSISNRSQSYVAQAVSLQDNTSLVEGQTAENIQAVSTRLDRVRSDIQRIETNVQGMNSRLDVLEVRSRTGVFVWKINNLQRRLRDAESGKVVSLYSPPFSTSEHGYKMCIRVYLNGDGSGKGEYISLFLVLMQSDHDDLLEWPFAQKVTLYLLNQSASDSRKHLKQSFMPSTSASFKKPTTPFNLASGFPKFAHKRILDDTTYVVDDTVYIKCYIDSSKIKGPDSDHS